LQNYFRQMKFNFTMTEYSNQFKINFFTPYLDRLQIHYSLSQTIELYFVRLKLNKV